MITYYLCRYRLDNRDRSLLWFTHDKEGSDGVETDPSGSVLTFATDREAQAHAAAHNLLLSDDEPAFYDLAYVARWLRNPQDTTVDCHHFNDAWNLFADIAASTHAPFEPDKARTDKVYQKLFWGLNLSAVTPEGRSYEPLWTKAEVALMAGVLRVGLALLRGSKENTPPFC